MSADAAVVFDRVTKWYASRWSGSPAVRAVTEVSLRIERGEVFGLLGSNQAGKTTLIKLLLSLCRPTSGQVVRLGRPASDRQTLAQVGYLPEQTSFPTYLTAYELLDYYASLGALSRAARRQKIPAMLERVGLAHRSREPIARYSKGMFQRLGVAQAILNDPDLLVLDEPTAGMDLLGRRELANLLRDRARSDQTVLMITHYADEAEQLCDRVGVLDAGRLAFLGPPSSLPGSSGRLTIGSALAHYCAGGVR